MIAPLFLAWRLVQSRSLDGSFSQTTALCSIGIIFSTAILGLVSSICDGFQHATLTTLKGSYPDLLIKGNGKAFNVTKMRHLFATEYRTTIASCAPISFHHILIQKPDNQADFSHVTIVGSIDPHSPVHMLKNATHSGHTTPTDYDVQTLKKHEIILGSTVAEDLGVKKGDKVIMRYLQSNRDNDGETIHMIATDATVVALFRSGLDEWDTQTAFISFAFATELFEDGSDIEQLQLCLYPTASLSEVQRSLHKRTRLPITAWYELHPSLISALKLERLGLWIILSLIMLVTGMTTVSLLCMHTTFHRKNFAVFIAYGMTPRQIQKILLSIGILVNLAATVAGLAIATLTSFIVDHWKLIRLPNVYYAPHLPAQISLHICLSIITLSMIITLVASLYTARHILSQSVGRVLTD